MKAIIAAILVLSSFVVCAQEKDQLKQPDTSVSGAAAATVLLPCATETTAIRLNDGTIMCVYGLKPLSPEEQMTRDARTAEELAATAAVKTPKNMITIVGGVAGDMYSAGSSSPGLTKYRRSLQVSGELTSEKNAARIAASQLLLKLDNLKVEFTSKTVGVQEAGLLNAVASTATFDAFPSRLKFTVHFAMDLCYRGELETIYAIDEEGFFVIQPHAPIKDPSCPKYQFIIDSLSGNGRVRVFRDGIAWNGEGQVRIAR